MTADSKHGRAGGIVALALSAALLVLYLSLGAKALNLDGLAYAGRAETGDLTKMLLPAHLLYAPIMFGLYRITAMFAPGLDVARSMQMWDSVFAAAGIGMFLLALRRLSVSMFTATASALALAFTYTYWTHGTDLTTYALSTFCLICAFYMMCEAKSGAKGARVWPVAAMVALATLIHQSNLVFIPAAALGVYGLSGNRARNMIKLVALSIVLIGLPYGILGSIAAGSREPAVIAKWAMLGAHGYAPTFQPVNLARGVYGLANALIYLDDAGTSLKGRAAGIAGSELSFHDLARLASKTAFAFALLGLTSAVYARRRRLSDEQKRAARVCAAWIVPYSVVALFFFTTDHDRWIMLLPAVVTLAAVAYPAPSARGRLGAICAVGVLFALNWTSGVYPAHLGVSNRYYQEALRLAPRLCGDDVVIFWGHDHIGTSGYLRQLKPLDAVHVVDMVRRRGKTKALLELTGKVETAIRSGRRVFVIGLYGGSERASDYLSEADSLGLAHEDAVRALSPFAAHPAFTIRDETGYRLRARASEATP